MSWAQQIQDPAAGCETRGDSLDSTPQVTFEVRKETKATGTSCSSINWDNWQLPITFQVKPRIATTARDGHCLQEPTLSLLLLPVTVGCALQVSAPPSPSLTLTQPLPLAGASSPQGIAVLPVPAAARGQLSLWEPPCSHLGIRDDGQRDHTPANATSCPKAIPAQRDTSHHPSLLRKPRRGLSLAMLEMSPLTLGAAGRGAFWAGRFFSRLCVPGQKVN